MARVHQVLLKNDEILRKKLLLAMWEGPYFARAVANVPEPHAPALPRGLGGFVLASPAGGARGAFVLAWLKPRRLWSLSLVPWAWASRERGGCRDHRPRGA